MSLNLLVLSDIHGSDRILKRIESVKNEMPIDLVVICGDITHFGTKTWAINFLKKIPWKTIGVTGNCDRSDIEEAYRETGGEYLHLNTYEMNGYVFTGISGSNHTEGEIEDFYKVSPGSDIFVLHAPPYGSLDVNPKGKHIGDKDVRASVEENEPMLVLSGHVHESRGTYDDGTTLYLNPGPSMNEHFAYVKIEGKKVKAKLF
ncbi:MAG: metallophosphoesterase family protein [Thermoplasmata archaeon]